MALCSRLHQRCDRLQFGAALPALEVRPLLGSHRQVKPPEWPPVHGPRSTRTFVATPVWSLFREGNARSIKLLTDLLAAQTGRPLLLYDMRDEGRQEYIESAKAAMAGKDYRPMVTVIRRALNEAQNRS